MTAVMPIRVTVLDAWDAIPLEVPPSTSLAEVKRRALEAARVVAAPADFLVKFRGVELPDESRSLSEAEVPPDGALIVLRRRRRAVR